MDELNKKIEKILEKKFPNQAFREEILLKVGEIAIAEYVGKISELLDDDEKIDKFTTYLANGDILNSEKICVENGINTDDILEEISKSLVTDLFS